MTNPHMIQQLTNKGKLLTKLIRSLSSTTLIVRIHLCTEGRLPRIKSHQNMTRLNPLQQMAQHQLKAINRIGMQTSRILKTVQLLIERKKRPKSNRRPINQ